MSLFKSIFLGDYAVLNSDYAVGIMTRAREAVAALRHASSLQLLGETGLRRVTDDNRGHIVSLVHHIEYCLNMHDLLIKRHEDLQVQVESLNVLPKVPEGLVPSA